MGMMNMMMNTMVKNMTIEEKEEMMLKMMPVMMKQADLKIIMKNMLVEVSKIITLYGTVLLIKKAIEEFDLKNKLKDLPQIMQEKIKGAGIYLLDEPEAALSPGKQLALIHFILEHLKQHHSQFIIATHSPILMSIPNSSLYEITESYMGKKALNDLEHYQITKDFLNNPDIYLKHLR